MKFMAYLKTVEPEDFNKLKSGFSEVTLANIGTIAKINRELFTTGFLFYSPRKYQRNFRLISEDIEEGRIF
jgi:hypothetical protein